MTKVEAINEICDMANALQIMYKSKQGQALTMAIEALENQKSIIAELEKIRVEIENHCGLAKDYCKYCSCCTNCMGVREILEVIDKYKAEIDELKGENKE